MLQQMAEQGLRLYFLGFPFAGLEVHFTVAGDVLTVCGIFPAEKA